MDNVIKKMMLSNGNPVEREGNEINLSRSFSAKEGDRDKPAAVSLYPLVINRSALVTRFGVSYNAQITLSIETHSKDGPAARLE